MSSMAERIQKAMDLRGMKQVDLCERTGIGKSSISTYLSGEYEPKQRNLYKIAEALEINVGWLMGAAGVPMEGDEEPPRATPNGDVMALRERLRRQPGVRLLLDATDGATEEDILRYAAMINALRKDPHDDT